MMKLFKYPEVVHNHFQYCHAVDNHNAKWHSPISIEVVWAIEQIMDIRQTLRYLGAPIGAKYFLFGDNRSVVTSATLPHSTLTKRHNILAFHRVREAIAAILMAFYWIQSATGEHLQYVHTSCVQLEHFFVGILTLM